MRARLFAVLALFGTGACGAEDPVSPPGPPATPPSLRSPSSLPAPSPGPSPVAGAERARAMAERPLTPADFEAYLALLPETRRAGGDAEGAREALEARGLNLAEWTILQARINAAYMALQSGFDPLAADKKGDIEAARPYRDRIEAVLRRR